MSKEILLVVEAMSNEKGVDKGVIFEAIESALASATKKRYVDEEIDARVTIDRRTGEYSTYRVWHVIADDAELELPGQQIRLSEARKKRADVDVGDTIEELMESVEFGRIAAQTAKQVILQKVREAERGKIVEAY